MTDKINPTRRRIVINAGLGVLAAGAAVAGARRAAAQEKLAQAIVQYQTTPKGGQQCDACVNWEAPNACKIVAGEINPKGWCVAFAPKG